MIFRAEFLLVALVSAITVCQTNLFRGRKRRSSSHSKHGDARRHGGRIGKEDGRIDASHVERREKEEKAETCRSESVPEGISDKPETIDCKVEISTVQESSVHEISHLKKVVIEMEDRRENLELGLIELYCLKEQSSRIVRLDKKLKDKMTEIEMLKNMLNRLQSEREKLYEEVKLNQLTEKQLQSARLTILELQLKMESEAVGLNQPLMRLEEQVRSFFDMDESSTKDSKSDQKIKDIRKVELKAIKMKRRNKELELEKRELGVKLDGIQARISELSRISEGINVARIQEETNRLKGHNHQLTEKVEELHKNRFSILEELVYQRMLNSCLRFEVQDHHSPQTRKVCRKLSFQSEDESKTSSMDPDSEISSTNSDEITNTTIESYCSRPSVKSKKIFSIFFNIKRWGGRRSSNDSSPDVNTKFFRRKPGLLRRFSMSSVPSDTTSGQRNRGVNDEETQDRPRVRRVSFNDSLNSVLSYARDDYSQKSVQETVENKRDWSAGMEKETEMMASGSKVSENLNINQESHGIKEEIGTEIRRRKEIAVSAECLSHINQESHGIKEEIGTESRRRKEIAISAEGWSPTGKQNMSPGAGKFRGHVAANVLVAFSVIVFLFFYICKFCPLYLFDFDNWF